MADMNINVGANTRQAERDIQKLVNRNYNINLSTRGGAPLGRITGQVNEFTKSLDASNARVIAFGASAGIIFGVQRAFGALVTSVIETQKSLADINVILNVSSQNLQKFGGELFNIAKNTGQSFQDVAKAATEFSRQGLGVEETLKRTNEALILSRLSGLDAAKSVEALTAAVNSYASQAVTASEVVNKFANVDAAFAVSSADLAEALARVGSSAAQSGVGLNELIAIVTSAQQTTARGGAVIGNSFKTIFTRLQRTKVIDLLDNLGVNTKDSSGEIKSTINLLTDLAKVYDQLGTLEQADVAEKVGGVFQINILKAALADLGKEYSIYNSALQVAGSTTDQAIRRNAELNKTYAAQLNALRENSQQAAAGVGERVLGPAFDRVVGNANTLLGGVNESDGQGVGATLGKGILDGLGQVIAGPGLALIGGVFIKLFADLSKFAGGSLKELLNLNSASKQQQALQQSVNQILQKNPDLFKLMSSGTAGLNKGAEILLNNLRAQTLELQKQQTISAQIASQFIKTGGVRVIDGMPTAPTPGKPGKPGKAAGYIPNFAATGGVSKRDAFAETIAAYQAGYEPKGVGKVDGKVYSKAESVVKFPGARDRGIVPPKDSLAGKQYRKDFKKTAGYDPYEYMEKGSAKGFIPNFAEFNIGGKTYSAAKLARAVKDGKVSPDQARQAGYLSTKEKQTTPKTLGTENIGPRLNSQNEYAAIVASPAGTIPFTQKSFQPQGKARDTFKGKGRLKSLDYAFNAYGVDSFEESKAGPSFEKIIQDNLNRAQQEIISKYSEAKGLKSSRITNEKSKSQVSSFAGFLFEDIIAGFLKRDEFDAYAKTAPDARFDFKPSKTIQDFFGIPSSVKAVEAKLNTNPNLMTSPSNTSSIANKIYAVKGGYSLATPTVQERDGLRRKQKLKAANGYIPNFAAEEASKKREIARAGSAVTLYSDRLGSLVTVNEPQIAKYGPNADKIIKKDHINRGQVGTKSNLMKTGSGKEKYKARGFIPNFAAEDTAPADIGSSIAALTAQLGGLAFMLSFSKDQYKVALAELTQSNVATAKANALLGLQTQRAAGVMAGAGGAVARFDAQIKAAGAGTFAQKAGAGIGTNAMIISLLGPILAETAANTIGKEDKSSRVMSSGASGLGQAATFAGFGAMLTPMMPLLGAGIGAAAGGLLGLVDVIKQASTDIPELSAAAQKASENLTRINDAGQKVQTSFEQIKGLRESGQAEKAGAAETELLSFIRKNFQDTPEFSGQLQTAVINQDTQSLQKALGENTNAVLKSSQAQERNLLIGKFIEDMGGKDAPQQFQDIIKIQDLDANGLNNLIDITNRASKLNADVVESATGVAARSGQVVPTEERTQAAAKAKELQNEIVKFLESIGQSETFINDFNATFSTDPAEGIRFLQKLKQPASSILDATEAAARNSAINNKVIAVITKTLQEVQSNYAILAKQAQGSLDLGFFRDSQVRGASTNMRVAETGSQAVIDELFGVITPSGKADKKTEAELIKINEDFSNGIQNSIDSVLSSIGSVFLEQNAKSFAALSKIGTGGEAQTNAETNLAAAEGLALQFKENFNVEKFRDILAAGAVGENGGFKENEIISKLVEEFKIDTKDTENQKTLESIRQALFKTNQEVIKSQVVLREQKTILANQKFQENIRALITSIQGAFGGLSAFLTDDVTVTSGIQKALANIEIIGEPTGEASTIEVGRNLARVNDEFNKLTGVNLNNVLGGEFVGQQTEARALDINKSLSPIISNIAKTLGPEAARKATNDLGKEAGLTDEELKTLSMDQILARVSKTFAEVQIGTGNPDEALIQRAKDQLPEELRKLLDGKGVKSLEQVTVTELMTANMTLTEILNAIRGGQQSADAELFKQKVQGYMQDPFQTKDSSLSRNLYGSRTIRRNFDTPKPSKTISRYASGFIPPKAMPAMINESIDIANGVGGALPTDRPKIERNFNGETVVRGSGETVQKNYKGTGEDAILTREMQKMPNFAEGSIPDKKYLNGRTAMSKATKNLDIPSPVSPILKGVGGVVGRLAGPIGLAASAYSLMDNFGGLPWSDKSKKPKEMSPKDMPDYLKEYRTGPRPKFSNFAEGSLPSVNIDGDVNEDLFRQLGRGLSGGSVDFNKRISKVENKAAGDIPFFEGDFGPERTLNYDLIKRANELNREYGQKMDPFQDTLSRNLKYQSALQDEEKKNFFDYLNKTKGYSSTQSEQIWNDTLKSTGGVGFGEEEAAKLKESYGWTSPVRNEIEKTYDAENILRTELQKIKDEFKFVSQPLRREFENIGADSGDFFNTDLTNRSLLGLFSNQREFNRLREDNKLFRQQSENARVAAKKREQRDRKNAKTEAAIKRSREVLAKSYELTAPLRERQGEPAPGRYDIDEYSGEQFTVDAARLGLRGRLRPMETGLGFDEGTFRTATAVDRSGLEGPKAIPRAIRTTKANAQFMLQTLVEAYTKSLSAQEKGRPTGAKMDQKRAIMAKVQEFKRLYEQGKYQSLEAIYNKHQKSDTVKDAYASYEARGIDPNAGYDAAMRAVGLDPKTGAPDIAHELAYMDQGSRINGRPTEEVLAEGRANRPSDPAYDAAMRAVGLDPETGAPIDGQKTYFGPGGAGLIDGIPAQEKLDEMKNLAGGFIPEMDSFMREMSAGFNPSEIYPKNYPELQGLNNPQGKANFNNVQEGTTAKERIAIGNRMMVPSLANSIPESAPASISLGGLTINEAQTGGKSKEYSTDFAKNWEEKASALALQIKGEMDQKYGRAMEIVAAGERKGSLPRVPPKSRGLVA